MRLTTASLTTLVQQFNVLTTPRATLSASLKEYVAKFNLLTVQTNALNTGIAKLTQDMQPAIKNLTNGQSTALATGLTQHIAELYVLMVNACLQYKQADALTLADYLHTDMVKDLNVMFASIAAGTATSSPPASVIFDTTNALNVFLNTPRVPTTAAIKKMVRKRGHRFTRQLQ